MPTFINIIQRMTEAGGGALLGSGARDSLHHFCAPSQRDFTAALHKRSSFSPFTLVDLRVCFGQISKSAVSSHLKSACSLGPALPARLPCCETQETTWSRPEANSRWPVSKLTQLPTDCRHMTCAPDQVTWPLVSRPGKPLIGPWPNCQCAEA